MNKTSSTTSDEILACARALIATGGYNGFSYADIADVVGIRKASIHHHFPSKAELVTTLVKRYREAAEEGITNLEHGIASPLDQLRAYIQYWKTCIGDASAPFCICALLAGELPAAAGRGGRGNPRLFPFPVGMADCRARTRRTAGRHRPGLCTRASRRKPSWPPCMAPCCRRALMATPPSSAVIMDPQLDRMAAKG
jgi:AcrR family transcriptional regulator